MKKEYKLALATLIVGVLVIGGVYYKKRVITKVDAQKTTVLDSSDRKIILPEDSEAEAIYSAEVRQYLDDLQELYKQDKAVLPLGKDELDSKGEIAQSVALKDKKFLSDTRLDNRLLHNDIMRVAPALKSMLGDKSKKACKELTCYVVEKYNYALNSTTRAIVDVDNKKVLEVRRFSNMQPDISARLTRIAKSIALNNPLVAKELGHTPTPSELSMANVRTNLKESPCEDKNHLCVAPTFADHKKNQALWAIVDLTKLKLATAKRSLIYASWRKCLTKPSPLSRR